VDAHSRAVLAGQPGVEGSGGLAEEQAALRRVATLVASGVPPEEVFAAVTEEVGRLLGTSFSGMGRYGGDDTVTVVATWAGEGEQGGAHPLVPGPWPLDGDDLASVIWRTGRAVRIDDYEGMTGHIAAFVRDELGIGSSVASPIVVEGGLWGTLFVHAKIGRPLPSDTESRLTGFTELVGTAIANTQARAEVGRLAEIQAALRRVATLVAQEASSANVFSAVTEEAGRLLGADIAALVRLEAEDAAVLVAYWSEVDGDQVPLGTRIPLEEESVASTVMRTRRPARADNLEGTPGSVAALARRLGVTSTVGTPIVVGDHVWGGMSVSSKRPGPLPADTEARIADFAELVATAILNAETRTELTASRARVVAAADETRRRIERDLHDGIQQRLVSLGLELRSAQATVPPRLGELEGELSHVAEELVGVIDELREISHGIHPAILSEGGLGPALRALSRRSPIPVELELHAERRLPEPVEVAAYYVVSEALTNAAKHAQASVVLVELDTHDAVSRLTIRDDGIGGADPTQGSGLVGLSDRIEALGGTLKVESPAGSGTTLLIELPLEDASGAVLPEP
jgi:signal transduction histidine kinase